MTKDGNMLPEEEAKIAKMMKTLDAMEAPDLPEYLRAENLAPAIARGLTHAEHRAEWEAKHGPVDPANDQEMASADAQTPKDNGTH